jgi:pimeloyl-ACP methyl ester carboxylesterase
MFNFVILTVRRFFGPLVEEQMKSAAHNVAISEVFEECGHSLSLEKPERLANLLKKFVIN